MDHATPFFDRAFAAARIPEKYRHLFDNYDPASFDASVKAYAAELESSEHNELMGRIVMMKLVRMAGSFRTYLNNVGHRLSDRVRDFFEANFDALSDLLYAHMDYNFFDHDLFSASSFMKTYPLTPHFGEQPFESPTMLYLRVAAQAYADGSEGELDRVIEAFIGMARHEYTHASPTLFNAGTKKPQCSSCFLGSLDDSLESILGTGVRDMGLISKYKGGLGIGVGALRHSAIGDAGMSSGLKKVLLILDRLVQYVNQGGSRAGAGTAYAGIEHKDIWEFVNATNNFSQSHALRLNDLNTAVWMHSLFFERVKQNGKWTAFCPAKSGLFGLYGDEFEARYLEMEALAEKREEEYAKASKEHEDALTEYIKSHGDESLSERCSAALRKKRAAEAARIDHVTHDARKLMDHISNLQIKSGFPYIMNGDTINALSNQRNIGVVNSSNLCVSGDTKILTRAGYVRISDAVGTAVDVWNGVGWSTVEPKMTSPEEDIMVVTLDNGMEVSCTPYHKFIVSGSPRVDAKDLVPGTKLARANFPVVDGSSEHDVVNPYTSGFFVGEGTDRATFGADRMGLIRHLALKSSDSVCAAHSQIEKIHATAGEIAEGIPTNATVGCRIAWLAGYFDSTGEYSDGRIQVGTRPRSELLEVQLLLTTLGVESCVGDTLIIEADGVCGLVSLGLTTNRLILSPGKPKRVARFPCVVSVAKTDRREPVYCFAEEKKHAGVFNGVLTGQCTEITEVSTPDEIASCNLASISLKAHATLPAPSVPTGASDEDIVRAVAKAGAFDFEKLALTTRQVVRNLDAIITNNYYPVPEKTKKLNEETRPLGIGVSGLSDVAAILDVPFDSRVMEAMNKAIFACMYYNAVAESCTLALKKGAYERFRTGSSKFERAVSEPAPEGTVKPYRTEASKTSNDIVIEHFIGSAASNGFFHFDLAARNAGVVNARGRLVEKVYRRADDVPISPTAWGQTETEIGEDVFASDWEELRFRMTSYGLRNSLLITCMPTASSAQILRNAESTEAHSTNLYARTVLSGRYAVVNQHLVKDLEAINLWNPSTVEYLKAFEGTMKYFEGFVREHPQLFPEFSEASSERLAHLVKKYATMYEISQKTIMRYARQRGIYVDQTQSLNIYLTDPDSTTVSAVHMFGNQLLLKTGIYYLRQRTSVPSPSFTVSANMLVYLRKVNGSKDGAPAPPPEAQACSIEAMRSGGDCVMCSS